MKQYASLESKRLESRIKRSAGAICPSFNKMMSPVFKIIKKKSY